MAAVQDHRTLQNSNRMGERMISEPNPEDIERQMAEMRSALQQDVRVLASEARILADWRTHFRAHPWLFCGVAAALGFILVPRARKVYSVFAPPGPASGRPVSEPAAAERANQHQLDGEASEKAKISKVLFQMKEPSTLNEGLVKPLLKMAAAILARESASFAMNRMRASFLDPKSPGPSRSQDARATRGGQP
jgi:hypothetical protein